MPDEIKQRLQDSTESCLKAYEAWNGDKKNVDARETLQGAVHELRKVASRLEIEIAVSDRSQMPQKPMPIPAHRDARGPQKRSDDGPGKGNEKAGEKKSDKPKHKLKPRKDEKKAGGGEG